MDSFYEPGDTIYESQTNEWHDIQCQDLAEMRADRDFNDSCSE